MVRLSVLTTISSSVFPAMFFSVPAAASSPALESPPSSGDILFSGNSFFSEDIIPYLLPYFFMTPYRPAATAMMITRAKMPQPVWVFTVMRKLAWADWLSQEALMMVT